MAKGKNVPIEQYPFHLLDTDLEAEFLNALIRGIEQGKDEVADLLMEVESDDFVYPDHQTLFSILHGLVMQGKPISFAILKAELRKAELDAEEFSNRLTTLRLVMDLGGFVSALPEYLSRLKEKAKSRRTHTTAHQIISRIEDPNCSVEDLFPIVDGLRQDLSSGYGSGRIVLTRADKLAEQKVAWLWKPYIPLGKLTVVQGDPGVGKTWLMLAVAAALSSGKHPAHIEITGPGDIIYLSAEDSPADTLKPRLRFAGAELSRIHFLEGVRDSRGAVMPLTLHDVDELERAIMTSHARMLVVDPIQAFMGITDFHKAHEVRPLLARIGALAERTDCSVILIRHLAKTKQERGAYRGLGTIDLQAAARSVLVVGQSAQFPRVRIMAHQKASLSQRGPSLGFRLDNLQGQGGFRWEAGSILISASKLLEGKGE